MPLFKFNDEKSRRQIDKSRNHKNDVSRQNADNLNTYRRKSSGLIDSRGEWEVADAIQTS